MQPRHETPSPPTGDAGALEVRLSGPDHPVVGTMDFLVVTELVGARLARISPLDGWLVLRRLGGEHVVLVASGASVAGLRPGDVLRDDDARAPWLAGPGPLVVADASRAGPPGPPPAGVGALVRLPLVSVGAADFGVVVGTSPVPLPEVALSGAQPVVGTIVDLLGTVLDLDLDRSRLQQRLDRAESSARSDVLTGLGNRLALDQAMAREESRCLRFGHPAGLVVVDLDGLKELNDDLGHEAGDDLLRRAGVAIRDTIRGTDQAFRIGGDEFAILLAETEPTEVDAFVARLRRSFRSHDVSASVGASRRRPDCDLRTALAEADAEMYEEKRRRSERRDDTRADGSG